MGILFKKGIMATRGTKTEKVFEGLFGDVSFEQVSYESPQDYISKYWKEYTKIPKRSNSLNGNMWECIVNTLLYREGILPFYKQAQVAFVPGIDFDILLYTPSFPINISLKTSLRERYKQADLEAIALKYVHRKAKSYLLTLDPEEAAICKEKVLSGDIIGLDKIIDCTTPEINELLDELSNMRNEFTISQKIEIVTGILIK